MSTLLQGLNEQQQEAVQATHGPVLILAGAGSGKTRALTHRIAYLIEQNLAQPEEILAVTFTNKAASEMKERVHNLLGHRQRVPSAISTFHSLGARMLRESANFIPRSPSFAILDTKDSEKLVRHALQEIGVPLRTHSPKSVRQIISSAKNALHSPESFASDVHGGTAEVAASIWPRYEQLLAANDAFDFDDLLVETMRLLEREQSVRNAYQHRWRFLHVDEYQDTNPLQEKILQLLLGPEKNICVVGDDYQAIYSWRGAQVDHILAFEHRYPACKVIHLTQNYRSTPQILQVAGEVIAGNIEQKHKNLWTQNHQGNPVQILSLSSDREEVSLIRRKIQEHQRSGGSLNDCAILYRTNAQSRLFEEEFLTHRIPYTIIGGFRFYERREIKDALAFLQWLITPGARLPFERISDALLQRVGPKTITKWEQEAQAQGQALQTYIFTLSATRRQLAPITRAYNTAPIDGPVTPLLQHLLEKSGYLDALKEMPDGEERIENINELLNVTSVYEDVASFLEEVSLLSDIDTQESSEKITCMTLHAAKGLEFPLVFVAGCEEELLPHSNSLGESAKIEEERRLLYVGITRAQQSLTLTHTSTRYQGGQLLARMPSRFLDEVTSADRHDTATDSFEPDPLPVEEEMEYVTNGQWITHPAFGKGVVIAKNAQGITCVFEGHGIKTISASSVNMQH